MAIIEIVFDSKYGQSAKIAEHVAELGRRQGHATRRVHVVDAKRLDLHDADAIVVIAPVFFGRHMKSMRAFVRMEADVLSSRPSAFLSVSGSAGSRNEADRAEAMKIAQAFVDESGARFRFVGIAGGAMAYPKYDPITRWVIRRISARRGGPTDTSCTHEATDWTALDRTMMGFFGLVREQRAHDAHP